MSEERKFVYKETPDGFTVRIPADKVKDWEAAQEKRIKEQGAINKQEWLEAIRSNFKPDQ